MRKAIGSRSRDPNFRMPFSTDSLSVTYIKILGRHRSIRCDESDRVMYIVEGDAIVKIGDEQPAHIPAADCVRTPRGTPYEFKGTFPYRGMNSPAYREGSDLHDDGY